MENPESNKAIQELQHIEHALQHLSMQKQNSQVELNELDNALTEIKASKEDVYRVLAGIMVKADKVALEKELEERKNVLNIRVQALEKQEKQTDEKAQKLKETVTKAFANQK